MREVMAYAASMRNVQTSQADGSDEAPALHRLHQGRRVYQMGRCWR